MFLRFKLGMLSQFNQEMLRHVDTSGQEANQQHPSTPGDYLTRLYYRTDEYVMVRATSNSSVLLLLLLLDMLRPPP